MEKAEFIQIVRAYESLQEERKELQEEIKDRLTSCASSHNIEPKVLKQAIKKFLAYEKDKNSYLEQDAAVDSILNSAIDDEKWGVSE